jgi:hypothetical protein
MTHLIDFVKSQAPATVAFEADSAKIKALLLAKIPGSAIPLP